MAFFGGEQRKGAILYPAWQVTYLVFLNFI